MQDEKEAVLYELFFEECADTMEVYKTALAGMCQTYGEVKGIAEDVCDGIVPKDGAVNIIFKLAFMRETFLKARAELTKEKYEEILDIPTGIINQFSKDDVEREKAFSCVRSFDGTSSFVAYERYVGLLAEI